MLNIVFYFQVHQPYRLKRLNFFDIGKDMSYFDETLNRKVIEKVSEKCYIPTNKLLLKLIDKYDGDFKVSFSITGSIIEQFKRWKPEVLDLFHDLAKTGCVEFIGETYFHSLSYLYNRDEFCEQINKHIDLVKSEFGTKPIVFRNTELIYQNGVSDVLKEFDNFKVILTEGADKVLGWRSPLYPYLTENEKHILLLKYYTLSDDIAFRFSDKGWVDFPLTVDKFVNWVKKLPLIDKSGQDLFLNLFMDYETFGEHQWEDTGIFKFMEVLPEKVLSDKTISFSWPSDVLFADKKKFNKISIPNPISWADSERDLSAWLSNDMQHNSIEAAYELLEKIKQTGNYGLLNIMRKLLTSDHFYYMCTKYFQDGDVHTYFSPYDNPYDAYNYFMSALTDLEERASKLI